MGLRHVLDELGSMWLDPTERMRACLFQVLHEPVVYARLKAVVEVRYPTHVTTLITWANIHTGMSVLSVL